MKYLALYFFALFVTLSFFYFYNPHPTVESLGVQEEYADERYYYNQGLKVAEGTYEINSYRPIGFPLIVGVALWLTGYSLAGAQIVLIFLSSLRAPFLYGLAKRITNNEWVAILSGIFITIWPSILYFSSSYFSESVSLPLFIAFLWAIPSQIPPYWRWILLGLFFGIVILIHPMFFMFLPFVFLIIAFENRVFFKAMLPFIIFVIGAAIVIAPWSYSVTKKENRFILLSANGADAIAGGINPNLMQGYKITPNYKGRTTVIGPGLWIWENGYLTEEEKKLPPKEREKLLYSRLWDWIKAHPIDFLYLEAAKVLNLWAIYPIELHVPLRFLSGNLPTLLLIVFSIVALWEERTRLNRLVRLWILPLFLTGVALLICGCWRYRVAADAGLLVLAAITIYHLIYHRSALKEGA